MTQGMANREAAILQKQQFASCWFLGERESYAMWNLYSNHESVAVKFKPEDLLGWVAKYAQDNVSHSYIETIVCGKVEYLPLFPPEYDGNKIKNPGQSYVGLRKDTSYISENEYRLLAIKSPNVPDYPRFELALDRLFEMDFKIFTHPKMQQRMQEDIASVLKSYGIENKLKKSEIRLRNI